jgi:hypothetical protein
VRLIDESQSISLWPCTPGALERDGGSLDPLAFRLGVTATGGNGNHLERLPGLICAAVSPEGTYHSHGQGGRGEAPSLNFGIEGEAPEKRH